MPADDWLIIGYTFNEVLIFGDAMMHMTFALFARIRRELRISFAT